MLKIHQLFLRTYIIIFLGIFFAFCIVTYYWSKNIYLQQIEKNLIHNIDTFSVVFEDFNNIDKQVKDLKSRIHIRITIIDEEGNVIAESDKNKKEMENHLNRIEVQKAKKNGLGKSIRISKTIHKELLYVAKRAIFNNKIYYIRMADYVDKITENFLKLILKIFTIFTFFIVIAFTVSYYISLRIKKETDSILDFLIQLSNKKNSFTLNSNYTLEFYNISKLLNKVSNRLLKRDKQKAKQNAKLKLANRQKDEIISALSHEFRNPIAIILGYTETIATDKDMPMNIRDKFLNKITSNANKMTQIIDKLRLTIKLEEGKQDLQVIPTSMKKILENTISDLEAYYGHRQIKIIGEDIIINVDETLISMGISNLIENALKYSSNNVNIYIQKNSLSIKDKGMGIEEKDLDKINQKFYRISHNGWNNSLGLGLFIVQSILKLHKFKLEIKSKIGVGSTFTIKF